MKATQEDIGAALMAWYEDSIRQYPEGLVTQAQAAEMLGISRVAVSRLVTRGYLRAVYFPKPPDIVGISVGHDDPTWLKIVAWLGDWDQTYAFPKAVYVSFKDVKVLWESGEAKKRCARDWKEIMAAMQPESKSVPDLKAIHADYQEKEKTQANRDREEKDSTP